MDKSLEIVEGIFGNFVVDEYDLIGKFIKQNGFWERHLYEIYSQIIDKEYYCVDAGANIGFHTIQFGFLGKKVYAFEPQRYVFNQLSANILFNGLDNVIDSYRLGLGEKEEICQIWNLEHENWVGDESHNWGGRGIIQDTLDYERANNNEFREEDTINVVSLDSLNIFKCDFIKLDIQGYEYKFLLGAKEILNIFKPIIFLENHIHEDGTSASQNEEDTKNHLMDLGYDFYRLNVGNKEDCILVHPQNQDYKKHVKILETFTQKYNIIKDENFSYRR
jgi:FkbM family methyltransferase